MRKLIVFSAPSGAGKTTVVRKLMEREERLAFSISACSRAERTHEVNGRDYYFLSKVEFEEKIKSDEFVEWEEVYEDMYYGTLHSELKRIFDAKKVPIFDVDVQGAIRLKEIFGKELLSVFVAAPNLEVLETRLRNRGTETEDSLKKRIGKAKAEWAFKDRFDVVLINDDLEEAVDKAVHLVKDFLAQAE